MLTTSAKTKADAPRESTGLTTTGNDTPMVYLRGSRVMTDTRVIASGFDKPHRNVLRKVDGLIEDGTIGRLNFELTSYVDQWNRPQRVIELDERAALIAMPFIGGRTARQGQARLVDAFLSMRDSLSAAQPSADRIQARREAASNYSAVSEILAMRRDADGKVTKPHHYSNEARLINFALVGEYRSVDRNALSASELRILTKLEVRDTALIGLGKSYDERKTALVAYADALRTASVARLTGGLQ